MLVIISDYSHERHHSYQHRSSQQHLIIIIFRVSHRCQHQRNRLSPKQQKSPRRHHHRCRYNPHHHRPAYIKVTFWLPLPSPPTQDGGPRSSLLSPPAGSAVSPPPEGKQAFFEKWEESGARWTGCDAWLTGCDARWTGCDAQMENRQCAWWLTTKLAITKTSVKLGRITTTVALGIVWRDRIQSIYQASKNVAVVQLLCSWLHKQPQL